MLPTCSQELAACKAALSESAAARHTLEQERFSHAAVHHRQLEQQREAAEAQAQSAAQAQRQLEQEVADVRRRAAAQADELGAALRDAHAARAQLQQRLAQAERERAAVVGEARRAQRAAAELLRRGLGALAGEPWPLPHQQQQQEEEKEGDGEPQLADAAVRRVRVQLEAALRRLERRWRVQPHGVWREEEVPFGVQPTSCEEEEQEGVVSASSRIDQGRFTPLPRWGGKEPLVAAAWTPAPRPRAGANDDHDDDVRNGDGRTGGRRGPPRGAVLHQPHRHHAALGRSGGLAPPTASKLSAVERQVAALQRHLGTAEDPQHHHHPPLAAAAAGTAAAAELRRDASRQRLLSSVSAPGFSVAQEGPARGSSSFAQAQPPLLGGVGAGGGAAPALADEGRAGRARASSAGGGGSGGGGAARGGGADHRRATPGSLQGLVAMCRRLGQSAGVR